MLGPFFPNDLETDFLAGVGGEANIHPKAGDTVTTKDGKSLTWKQYTTQGNIIERTVLFVTGGTLEPHHLSLPETPLTRPQPRSLIGAGTFSIVVPDRCTTLEQVEQEVIRQAYAYTGGNVTQAAKLIGLARETFRRKLAQRHSK